MKKEPMIKQLVEDNKSDLGGLDLSNEEYEKLKQNWLNKETDEFEIIGKIELRKQIIKKLNNLQKF